MIRMIEMIGKWFEWARGPRTITMITQDRVGRSYSFRHVVASELHSAYVESERLVYRVCFHRWWVPDIEYCIFKVQGRLDDHDQDDQIDGGNWREFIPAGFFEVAHYPSTVSWLLQWTRLPHLYAIHTHMDRYHFHRENHPLP